MSRFLMMTGVLILCIGILIQSKVEILWLPTWIGKLPGDITIQKGNVTIYFPIVTAVAISILLSILFHLLCGKDKEN